MLVLSDSGVSVTAHTSGDTFTVLVTRDTSGCYETDGMALYAASVLLARQAYSSDMDPDVAGDSFGPLVSLACDWTHSLGGTRRGALVTMSYRSTRPAGVRDHDDRFAYAAAMVAAAYGRGGFLAHDVLESVLG